MATLSAITLVFLIAGAIKGALGLGLPTIGMGLLGLFLTPATAAALLFLPSLLTNAWQGLADPVRSAVFRRLRPMLLASFLSTLAFSPLLATGAQDVAGFWLGVALLAYGLSGLLNLRLDLPARTEPFAGIVAGALTGFVTGATGVFVLPAVPYLVGIGLNRDRLVVAMGQSFTCSTLALGAGLWFFGAFAPGVSWIGVLAILPALLGMAAGAALRSRIAAPTFRKLFFLVLIALGLHAILNR